MMSVVLEIAIPDELIDALEHRAQSAGLNREQYVSTLVTRELSADRTIDEILAPFRAQVAASGITDEELDELFRTARAEVHAQKS